MVDPSKPKLAEKVEIGIAGPTPEERAAERKAAVRAEMLAAPVFVTLLKLALPTTIVLIAQTAVGVVETFYVGFLGTDALAGVALVFPMFMLMTTMSNGGLGSGVASAVARAVGAGRKDDADALVLHSIGLAIVMGLTFTLGIWVFGRSLYGAMGGEGAALAAALTYSNYLFAAAVPVWIVSLLSAALRGSGNVRAPALVTLLGVFVLVPVSPALIFGIGPIPRFGIAGAGLAFGLYFSSASLVLLAYMLTGRSGLRLTWTSLQPRLLADILRVGVPVAVTTVQTNLTVVIVTGLFGLFGTNAIAGYGTASRLDYVMIPLMFGFASAVLTMVGINMGAGHVARARHVAWVGALTGAAITGTIGILAALFPLVWLHIFTNDADVLSPAMVYLRIVAPCYGLFGLSFIIGFAAQGAGKAVWPLASTSARMLVAAGVGWYVVVQNGAGLVVLAAVIAASHVVAVAVNVAAMFMPSVWEDNRSVVQAATMAGKSDSALIR